MPALAQTSSASHPGAPETPIDPTMAPADSIGRPSPMDTMRGRCRTPDAASSACVERAKLVVSSLKVTFKDPAPKDKSKETLYMFFTLTKDCNPRHPGRRGTGVMRDLPSAALRAAEIRALDCASSGMGANAFTVARPMLPAGKRPIKWPIGTNARRNSWPAISGISLCFAAKASICV